MPAAPEDPNARAPSTTDWAREHESTLLLMLVALGAILRGLLALRSPTPYGYVFDFYHEAIQKLYSLGRLPGAADCWQCYHPPLLPLLGLPFYALGKMMLGGPAGLADPALRFVAPLALACGGATAWYSYRILRWYRFRGMDLVLGTGLILAFPCLFISSYGIEADILLTALMTAFFFYLLEFLHPRRRVGAGSVVRLGALAGLACATKYTGLLAPAILIVLTGLYMLARRDGASLVRRTSLALVVCAVVGSWRYVDNLQRHHTLLFANGSAQQGFAVANRPSFWSQYDFHTLRVGELWRLTHGRVPPGDLTNLPFYKSVWTTLHAMAWGDMSFFSDPSRHGYYRKPYPRKAINPTLAFSVLLLGLVPNGLAVAGFLVTLRRPLLWPLAVSSALALAAYIAWFLAQESWALKTKYLLFLLPAYVVYTLFGLRWIRRLSRRAADVAVLLLALLIVAAHLYLLNFAWS
jgi:4-amino-4-deoxy-L-arabinose transferase-like glycosyltransferase